MTETDLATIAFAVFTAIVSAAISWHIGYRRAAQEASGRIRQAFQITISQIRVDRRADASGRGDEQCNNKS